MYAHLKTYTPIKYFCLQLVLITSMPICFDFGQICSRKLLLFDLKTIDLFTAACCCKFQLSCFSYLCSVYLTTLYLSTKINLLFFLTYTPFFCQFYHLYTTLLTFFLFTLTSTSTFCKSSEISLAYFKDSL